MALTPTKYYGGAAALAEKDISLETDDFYVLLSNTAPDLTDVTQAQCAEIANGNGYTTNGAQLSVSYSASAGVAKITGTADVQWTASGGAIATCRYAIVYDRTADVALCSYDYGSSFSAAEGEKINFNANGVDLYQVS